MRTAETLNDILKQASQSSKGITFINSQDNEVELSYNELYQRAQGLLFHFQEFGCKAKSELILLLNDNQQFVEAFWAAILGGIVPVPLAVGNSDYHREKLFRIFTLLQNPSLYTTRKIFEKLEIYAAQNNLHAELEQLRQRVLFVDGIKELDRLGKEHATKASDLAFIQFSSGSTATPKGVMLTQQNLLTNINAIISGALRDKTWTSLSWMPLTHDMGLIGFHLSPICAGISHYLMPTELFVRHPLLWLQKISEKRINVSASPNFGYKHCLKRFTPEKIANLDLSSLQVIFNGAEPISKDICDEFLEACKAIHLPNTAIFPVYGLAEATLAATFSEPMSALRSIKVKRKHLNLNESIVLSEDEADSLEFICVGKPVENCQVRITNTARQELPSNHVGHIELKGNNITPGYYQQKELTGQTISGDGWLDTGDLGFFHNNELYITGRAKEILIINGVNYYPEDLENIIRSLTKIELGKIAVCRYNTEGSTTDQALIFVAGKYQLEEFYPLAQQIRQQLSAQLGIETLHILPCQQIPKTSSGKIQRHLLAEQFEQGEYIEVIKALNAFQSNETSENSTQGISHIEAKLKQICQQVIPGVTINTEDNIFDIAASSLTLAQIHEQIDHAFPEQLEITELFDYPTIASLANYLNEKTSEKSVVG